MSGWLAKENGSGMSSGLRESPMMEKKQLRDVCADFESAEITITDFLFRQKLLRRLHPNDYFFSGIFSILVSVQPQLGIRRYDKVFVANSCTMCDVTCWRGSFLAFFKFSRS